MSGNERESHETRGDGQRLRADAADPAGTATTDGTDGTASTATTDGTATTASTDGAARTASAAARTARPAWSRLRGLPVPARLWLLIFGGSLGLFLVRFLVPAPVGQADNRDGPRLMCGVLGLGPVYPHGYPRYFRYAWFQYAPASCGRGPYLTSEIVPLEVARLLTPAFSLPGTLNLIALGVQMCVLASVAIASLATGLRVRPWAQLLVAAALWLIVADAAFFDLFASPFSEPAALVGLLLVAAGLVYLGRDRRASARGLALAGTGGFAVALSKEEYVFLAVPVCLALVLASASRGGGTGVRRFRTAQTGAAAAVAAGLAVFAVAFGVWNAHSPYDRRTQPMRAVDTIFEHIVNPGDPAKRADLRALGLPPSWAKYAGTYYWASHSVRNDPLYHRYERLLTDSHLAGYYLTHPGRIISVGQQAAVEDQPVRVTGLGDYAPAAGHRPGAVDSRVIVVSWLAQRLPPRLGLLWLVPLWTAMTAVALLALLRRDRRPWHRDAAVVVLCMTGCAIVGFIPAAYFDGISTARHMVGTNLADALALAFTIMLAGPLIRHAATARGRRRTAAAAAPAAAEPASQPQQAP